MKCFFIYSFFCDFLQLVCWKEDDCKWFTNTCFFFQSYFLLIFILISLGIFSWSYILNPSLKKYLKACQRYSPTLWVCIFKLESAENFHFISWRPQYLPNISWFQRMLWRILSLLTQIKRTINPKTDYLLSILNTLIRNF